MFGFLKKKKKTHEGVQLMHVPFAEVVLADGKFVTCYVPTVGHHKIASDLANNATEYTLLLILACTRVDDKPFEKDDFFNLPMSDFKKISSQFEKYFGDAENVK